MTTPHEAALDSLSRIEGAIRAAMNSVAPKDGQTQDVFVRGLQGGMKVALDTIDRERDNLEWRYKPALTAEEYMFSVANPPAGKA